MTEQLKTPNLAGLSPLFKVEVCGEEMTFVWISGCFPTNPSTNDVMHEIAERGLQCPSEYIAGRVFDHFKNEVPAKKLAAFDGDLLTDSRGDQFVRGVVEDDRGRVNGLAHVDDEWPLSYYFLAIVDWKEL